MPGSHIRPSAALFTSLPIILLLCAGFATGQKGLKSDKKPLEFTLGDKVVLQMVPLPPGKFFMGAPRTELDEILQKYGNDFSFLLIQEEKHEVELTRKFCIGKYEVSRGQFRQFVREEEYLTESEVAQITWFSTERPTFTWKNAGFGQDDRQPVVCVTWNDAMAFCRWLSRKTGKTFDLPTEAEWEYACRAGTRTAFSSGDEVERLQGIGNFADQDAGAYVKKTRQSIGHTEFVGWSDGFVFTAPVGSYRPNAFGIHDMHGNVAEWCKDRYQADLAIDAPRKDPQGPTKGKHRVVRGGGYTSRPLSCRSAARRHAAAGTIKNELGFRVVMRLP